MASGDPFAQQPQQQALIDFFSRSPMIYATIPGGAPSGFVDTSFLHNGPMSTQRMGPPGTGQRDPSFWEKIKYNWDTNFFGTSPGVTYSTPGKPIATATGQGLGQVELGKTPSGPQVAQINAETYWQSWFSKSRADIDKLQLRLVALHLPGMTPGSFTEGKFDYATQQALGYVLINVAQISDPNVTIDKYLSSADVGGAPPTTSTKTEKHTQYTSAADAAGQYQQTAQALLGHRASATAAMAAYDALHGAEAANPLTTTTTTTFDALTGQTKNANAVTTGGLGSAGAQDLMERQAESAPDFGTYQAATTFYNEAVARLHAASTVGT